MRLLLDENVPRQLKQDITGHEVYTIREKRWNGKLNGELLQLKTILKKYVPTKNHQLHRQA